MGENDVVSALGHLVLAGSAGFTLKNFNAKSFTTYGTHGTFLIHGLIGCLNDLSPTTGLDVAAVFAITARATKYITLPCLNAQVYKDSKAFAAAHFISGLIPFVLSVTENELAPVIGNVLLAGNIISLCYYAFKKEKQLAWYCAGASLVTYFGLIQVKPLYPIGLAITNYLASAVVRDSVEVILLDKKGRPIVDKEKEKAAKEKEKAAKDKEKDKKKK